MRNLVVALAIAILTIAFTSTSEAIEDPDLVLYCPFSADAGDVIDESGNALKGIVEGAEWTQDGKVGGGMAFTASGNYVEFPAEEILNITTEITMEAWAMPDAVQGDSGLLGRRTSANAGGYCMQWTNGMFETWIGKGGWQGTRDKQTIVPDPGEWYHVAAVYDGSKVSQYVDGELDVEFDLSGDIDSVDAVFRIGQAQTGLESIIGLVDEVAVYSRALTQDEIKLDMEVGVIPAAVSSADKLATIWANIKR